MLPVASNFISESGNTTQRVQMTEKYEKVLSTRLNHQKATSRVGSGFCAYQVSADDEYASLTEASHQLTHLNDVR